MGLDEAIMLLSGLASKWLEPVGVVGGTHLDGPFFHRVGDVFGNAWVELFAVLDGFSEQLIGFISETLLHLLVIEDVSAECFVEFLHIR